MWLVADVTVHPCSGAPHQGEAMWLSRPQDIGRPALYILLATRKQDIFPLDQIERGGFSKTDGGFVLRVRMKGPRHAVGQIVVQTNAKTNTAAFQNFTYTLEQPQTLASTPWKISLQGDGIPVPIRRALGMSVHARFGQDHPVACVARQDLQGEEPSAHASLSDSSLPNLGKRVRRSVHSSVHSGAHPSPSGKRVAKDCARDFGACSVTQLRQIAGEMGVDLAGCVEKSDIVERLQEQRERDCDADDLVITSDKLPVASKDPLTCMDLAVEDGHFPLALPCGHVYNYSTLHTKRSNGRWVLEGCVVGACGAKEVVERTRLREDERVRRSLVARAGGAGAEKCNEEAAEEEVIDLDDDTVADTSPVVTDTSANDVIEID